MEEPGKQRRSQVTNVNVTSQGTSQTVRPERTESTRLLWLPPKHTAWARSRELPDKPEFKGSLRNAVFQSVAVLKNQGATKVDSTPGKARDVETQCKTRPRTGVFLWGAVSGQPAKSEQGLWTGW